MMMVRWVSSPTPEELATARELVGAAQARGVSFADTADGVLKALTKTVVETALHEELSDHLGYDRHDPAGRGCPNSRNGTRTKTVLTDTVGPVEIAVPRDRDGSFEPQLVKKRQRRLTRVDEPGASLLNLNRQKPNPKAAPWRYAMYHPLPSVGHSRLPTLSLTDYR
jgi:putative transposase